MHCLPAQHGATGIIDRLQSLTLARVRETRAVGGNCTQEGLDQLLDSVSMPSGSNNIGLDLVLYIL